MGRLHLEFLNDQGGVYACGRCLTRGVPGCTTVHVAAGDELLSKARRPNFSADVGIFVLSPDAQLLTAPPRPRRRLTRSPSPRPLQSFHSRNGAAYLFVSAVNVTLGPPEQRDMTTGRHVVRDVHCIGCATVLGWHYVTAEQPNEKYKEGKCVLERAQIVEVGKCVLERAQIAEVGPSAGAPRLTTWRQAALPAEAAPQAGLTQSVFMYNDAYDSHAVASHASASPSPPMPALMPDTRSWTGEAQARLGGDALLPGAILLRARQAGFWVCGPKMR